MTTERVLDTEFRLIPSRIAEGAISAAGIVGVVGTVALAVSSGSWWPLALCPLLPFAAFAVVSRPSTVSVGSDGLLIRQYGQARFIPFSDVRAVDAREEDYESSIRGEGRVYSGFVVVSRKSGPDARLLVWRSDNRDSRGEVSAQPRLIAAIEQSLAAYHRHEIVALAQLDAEGSERWCDAVIAMSRNAGSYRAVDVSHDELLRMLESPGATRRSRAAAAYLLRRRFETKPEKIRVVAEATADPVLKASLHAFADDDASLEEALGAAAAQLRSDHD